VLFILTSTRRWHGNNISTENRFSKVIALADVRFIYSEQQIQG